MSNDVSRRSAPTAWVTAERVVLSALLAGSAVTWAWAATVLQPLNELTSPEGFAGNNTYWARELRWGALIALTVVLVVIGRGGRRATCGGLVAGGAWLAADVVVDRIGDVPGTAGFAAGAAVAALLCGAVVRAVPSPPGREALFAAAIVAAVASGVMTATESPTDEEAALATGSATVGALLAAVAVVAAVRATGSITRMPARTTMAVAAAAVAVPWLVRTLVPYPSGTRWLGILAFTVLLLVGVVAVADADAWLHRRRYGVMAAVLGVVLPVMFLSFTLLAVVLQIGKPFTALAANTPIDAADEDVVLIVLAVPVGLVLSRVLRQFARTDGPRAAS